MDKRNLLEVAVLNSYTATPVTLAGGKVSLPNATGTIGWGSSFRTALGVDYTKTAYTAGTAGVWDVTFPTTPRASSNYFLTISFPNAPAFPTGGQETNALINVRTYTVYTAPSGETGTTLAQKFEDQIDADAALGYGKCTASNAGAVLTVTQTAASLAALDGLADLTASSDVTVAATTPQVLPAGTAEIVNMIAGAGVATGSQYTTYDITVLQPTINPIVNGAYALKQGRFVAFLNEADGDLAAATTLIDAILAGTSTAANYLGID
jgi:hypothetical protein